MCWSGPGRIADGPSRWPVVATTLRTRIDPGPAGSTCAVSDRGAHQTSLTHQDRLARRVDRCWGDIGRNATPWPPTSGRVLARGRDPRLLPAIGAAMVGPCSRWTLEQRRFAPASAEPDARISVLHAERVVLLVVLLYLLANVAYPVSPPSHREPRIPGRHRCLAGEFASRGSTSWRSPHDLDFGCNTGLSSRAPGLLPMAEDGLFFGAREAPPRSVPRTRALVPARGPLCYASRDHSRSSICDHRGLAVLSLSAIGLSSCAGDVRGRRPNLCPGYPAPGTYLCSRPSWSLTSSSKPQYTCPGS